ncbi:hypothetical protein CEXT_649951 [Caerostris extrusa]|uniref:Uncharacterized protein n=1 Tax=Caerostris extrusa TaxID=172846 RepID=A0AAV4MA60_CAEEX|nr:hypothetical protein CEXT_649951 [Caerostris extrusa]
MFFRNFLPGIHCEGNFGILDTENRFLEYFWGAWFLNQGMIIDFAYSNFNSQIFHCLPNTATPPYGSSSPCDDDDDDASVTSRVLTLVALSRLSPFLMRGLETLRDQ